MAPRANWKGYLKLSLVSCAVALYPATSTSGRVRFNIINRQTGHRVHNQVVDAETGEPVEPEDRVKGYRAEGGKYVLIEEEDFERVALESTHTIDIEGFVPREEIDEIYLDESYYIAPDDGVSVEAFAVIREAMRKKDVVGLARVVLYRRERLLMLQPRGKGLMATALRFANEVRDKDKYFEDVPDVRISGEMLDLATHILNSKKEKFEPSEFEDRYETALVKMIKAKRAGKELPEAPEPPATNVVNLMDALRQSIKGERSTARRKPAKSRASARKQPAKRRVKKAS